MSDLKSFIKREVQKVILLEKKKGDGPVKKGKLGRGGMKKKIKDAVATGDYGEVANLSDDFMALILDSRWEWAEVARDLEAKIATSKDVGSVAALSLQLQRLQVGGRWQDWGFQLSHSASQLPQIEKRFREHVQGLLVGSDRRTYPLARLPFVL